MMRYRTIPVGLLALLVPVLGVGACGPGAAPGGQPPMVVMTEQAMETVRQQFNQAADQTRVVLLLSPT